MKTNEKRTDKIRIVNNRVERLYILYDTYRHPYDDEPTYDSTWEWRPEGEVPKVPACTVPSDSL